MYQSLSITNVSRDGRVECIYYFVLRRNTSKMSRGGINALCKLNTYISRIFSCRVASQFPFFFSLLYSLDQFITVFFVDLNEDAMAQKWNLICTHNKVIINVSLLKKERSYKCNSKNKYFSHQSEIFWRRIDNKICYQKRKMYN